MAGITYNLPREKYAGAWVGDELNREHVLSGGAMIDPSQFPKRDSVKVTVGAGGAAQNATSVPVTALPGAIPSGTILNFGANKFARLTSPASLGATSITVAAIPTALVAGDVATYEPKPEVYVPSGTLVGRTYAERSAGTAFGPAATDGSDDEVFLILYDKPDASKDPEVSLYRKDSIVYERYLPASSKVTAVLDMIRARYTCKLGSA